VPDTILGDGLLPHPLITQVSCSGILPSRISGSPAALDAFSRLGRRTVIPGGAVTFVMPADDRVITMPADDRVIVIPEE
jgi:hypothetical protein